MSEATDPANAGPSDLEELGSARDMEWNYIKGDDSSRPGMRLWECGLTSEGQRARIERSSHFEFLHELLLFFRRGENQGLDRKVREETPRRPRRNPY